MAGLNPEPYTYPKKPHQRRHGPAGWSDYRRYRPWLRDEFTFRCVFCLERECWTTMRRENPVDHYLPRALRPDLVNDYNNLLYVCSGCNSLKGVFLVPDPCIVAIGDCLRVNADGTIEATDGHGYGMRLIEVLGLDNPKLTRQRQKMIKTMKVLIDHDRDLFIEWMGFPEDLPDLNTHTPPTNTRPEGVSQSWFAKKQRGELPDVY